MFTTLIPAFNFLSLYSPFEIDMSVLFEEPVFPSSPIIFFTTEVESSNLAEDTYLTTITNNKTSSSISSTAYETSVASFEDEVCHWFDNSPDHEFFSEYKSSNVGNSNENSLNLSNEQNLFVDQYSATQSISLSHLNPLHINEVQERDQNYVYSGYSTYSEQLVMYPLSGLPSYASSSSNKSSNQFEKSKVNNFDYADDLFIPFDNYTFSQILLDKYMRSSYDGTAKSSRISSFYTSEMTYSDLFDFFTDHSIISEFSSLSANARDVIATTSKPRNISRRPEPFLNKFRYPFNQLVTTNLFPYCYYCDIMGTKYYVE